MVRITMHAKKPLACAKGFFWGEGLDRTSVGPSYNNSVLLQLLLLRGAGGRGSGVAGELLQIVLQQADFNTAAADALGLRGLIRGDGRVAHADEVDAVDRNLVGEHEVAHDRLGNLLRVGDGSLSLAGREALHFEDVPV